MRERMYVYLTHVRVVRSCLSLYGENTFYYGENPHHMSAFVFVCTHDMCQMWLNYLQRVRGSLSTSVRIECVLSIVEFVLSIVELYVQKRPNAMAKET